MELDICCGEALALQQPFERVRVQKFEGRYDHIGGEMLTIVAYADASHPGASSSFDAGDRIFHDNAPLGRCANPRSRGQVHLGIWFASVHIVSRDDTLKDRGR